MITLTPLYVPGSRADRFAKAAASGTADIVLDLEDAVAPAEKESAREAVAGWLAERGGPGDAAAVGVAVEGSATGGAGVRVWVRVNADPRWRDDDLRAVASAGADGVWLPKTESAAELDRVDAVLSEVEGERRLPVSPLVESGLGIIASAEIARHPRVAFLQLGEYDLAADLDLEIGADGAELAPLRSQIVVASSAAGLPAPLGAVSVEILDAEALAADTAALRRAGFFGRACIHPAQLEPVARAFRPSAEDVAWAEGVLGLVAGSAVARDASGRLVDEAVARRARRIRAAAVQLGG